MDTKLMFSCLFSYIFSLFLEFGCAKWQAEKCTEAGFSSNLLCNSCDDLNRFNLSILEPSCRECCGDVMEDTGKEYYPRATLKVCQWKIGRYPQIQAFVRGEQKDMFNNLNIQYERGADPQLLLHDESNNIKETLAIDKWDTDTVTAFLKEKLRQ